MTLGDWLDKWDMTGLKFSAYFLGLELKFNDGDRKAAWEMYIELLTRVTTQYLTPNQGDEAAALASVHKLFPITRGIIKHYGKSCLEFTRIAIVVLNQVIRPFTTKWHGKLVHGSINDPEERRIFREELRSLQNILRNYTRMLGRLAGVEEDLTDIEDV